jgi:uncharacterized protein YndB with AHSA1/START domain
MAERTVVHSTFTLDRVYPSPPEKVFAAFSDPTKKRRWFAGGDSLKFETFQMDFRVGGTEIARFRSKEGDRVFQNDTVYRDILPNRRIVFAYNMSVGETRFSSSLATIELLPTKKGTELAFTEQSAFFEGADGPEIRREGWRLLLERLSEALAGSFGEQGRNEC